MRLVRLLHCWLLALLPLTARAQAVDERELPRAVAEEVLQWWNAPATLRVDGPYTVVAAREVNGDIAVLGGTLTIAGHVAGRVIGINADVRLEPGARIDGAILVVGGRVLGRDSAIVAGEVRTYREVLEYERDGDRLVHRATDTSPQGWWRRRDRWHRGAWGDLRLVSARTYNRVEGLPLHLGPRFGRDFAWGRALVDGYGILRSADGFEWKSENLGHSLRAELQFGHERGVRIGGRLFDEVESAEAWQLGDAEVGLASFFLHRDFRDYFNRHGGALSATLFGGRDVDVSLTYADQRWRARRTRDPWTVFRNEETWRANPAMDEGRFHLVNAAFTYDTRSDPRNPWSGWFVKANYEYGTGVIDNYAPTTPDVRFGTPGGATSYDRIFLDVRRYNRLSPRTQLNMRLVTGGWLSGDDLPLQRRFSLGGPGTMPGYDFRRESGSTDVLTCNTPVIASSAGPAGTPAQCERFALAQLEYRSDLNLDPFGVLDEDREWRRAGWGRGTQWVLFTDIGRGWLVGQPDGALTYGKRSIPGLGSFRADVGLGLVLDEVGLYVSRALTRAGHGVNVTVRLRPRF
jgi:Omp85 superfamily domain